MATNPAGAGPGRHPELRASDADREQVASVLRDAAAEGRLAFDELDERLTAAYAAKTYADLEPLTKDLPDRGAAQPVPAGQPASSGRIGGDPTSHLAVGIMSGFRRAGTWVVPAEFTAVAIMGGGELDLREARFAQREVRIWALALCGAITWPARSWRRWATRPLSATLSAPGTDTRPGRAPAAAADAPAGRRPAPRRGMFSASLSLDPLDVALPTRSMLHRWRGPQGGSG